MNIKALSKNFMCIIYLYMLYWFRLEKQTLVRAAFGHLDLIHKEVDTTHVTCDENHS